MSAGHVASELVGGPGDGLRVCACDGLPAEAWLHEASGQLGPPPPPRGLGPPFAVYRLLDGRLRFVGHAREWAGHA